MITADQLGNDLEIEKLLDEAKRGDRDAQFSVGIMHYFGSGVEVNIKLAIEWMTRAAELRNDDAIFFLRALGKIC